MKITMKRFAALVAILGVTALVFGLGTGQADAVAADNTYMTNSFDVEITANENFSFDITENIQVDFAEAHHGIYRYVPLNDSEISNIEVPGYNFDAYKDSGNMVINIGSGDKYLIGVNDYYKVVSMDSKRLTMIHTFNIHDTLNKPSKVKVSAISVPIVDLPTELIALRFKTGSNNTVEMYLNNGWQLSFRIHNASTKVEPSLKFDVQFIGMPVSILNLECRWK